MTALEWVGITGLVLLVGGYAWGWVWIVRRDRRR